MKGGALQKLIRSALTQNRDNSGVETARAKERNDHSDRQWI